MTATLLPGSATLFSVDSESGASYQVDTASFDAIGQCGCQQWEFRLGPKIKAMDRERRRSLGDPDDLRCKHVKAARAAYADPCYLTQLLRAVTQEAEDGP